MAKMRWRWLGLAILAGLGSGAVHGAPVVDPANVPTSEALVAFNKRFLTPKLVRVAPAVYTAFAYDSSNFSFIEGDSGIIVIDAGWFEASMTAALAELRKITRKPVVAIIYTHPHRDHIGGARVAADEALGPIKVIGPSDFSRQNDADNGALAQSLLQRGFSQMGLALPYETRAKGGLGIGPAPKLSASRDVAPNILIDRDQDMTIDGVDFRIFRAEGDIPESLLIWMPGQKILFIADNVGGIFPFLETPRYEPAREPRHMMAAIDASLALKPEKVVPGHGRLLLDATDVRDVLTVNRDVIQFMIDQLDAMFNRGMSGEQIVHMFRLPKALAEHPDIQPHYHRISWMVRGMLIKRGGFFTELMDLVRLDGVEENRRMVALAGGQHRVLAEAERVLSSDPRWAARLATMVLGEQPTDAAARSIRQAAFAEIARTTDSANERNHVLTKIAEEQGRLNWRSAIGPVRQELAATRPVAELMGELGKRVSLERSEGKRANFRISVAGEEQVFPFELRNSVLVPVTMESRPDVEIVLSRTGLNLFHAGFIEWKDLLDRADSSRSGNPEALAVISDILL